MDRSSIAVALSFTPSPSRGPRRADDPATAIARLAMQTRTAIKGVPKKAETTAHMAADILGQIAEAAARGLDADQARDATTALQDLLSAIESGTS